MNVAILHYHLNRGGVSRVIVNQLAALDAVTPAGQTCRVAILHGGRADGWPDALAAELKRIDLSIQAVSGLDYDDRAVAAPQPLADRLQQVLDRIGFAPDNALLHVHNHSLGKNASFPGAVTMLADRGYGLLLQVHDFAEDFRPHNYRLLRDAFGDDNVQAIQLPQAPHIHYAVLNRRDEKILHSAGIAPERLHWLPNPVPALGPRPDRDAARDKLAVTCGITPSEMYLLYPVRGIRRKNLGELLLFSAIAGQGVHPAVTLAPLNPRERAYYDRWESLATELRLPCHFDTGSEAKLTFAENLAAADRIVTTSVAEGFGMVFLEAWLAGRELVGRDLPEITADFRDAGLDLEGLYPRIDVPVDWIGEDVFRSTFRAAYDAVSKSYGRPAIDDEQFEHAVQSKIVNGNVDFADLDEEFQEHVIRRIATNSADGDRLLGDNPWLDRAVDADFKPDQGRIHQNAQLIESQYSVSVSGLRLRELYQKVLSSPRGAVSRSCTGSLLDRFLDPQRFRSIRT